jgi:rod shape-determining protein MreB
VKTKTPTVASNIVNAVLSHVRNNKDALLVTQHGNRNPFVLENPAAQSSDGEIGQAFGSADDTSTLLVGLDWGASKTCIKAAYAGSSELVIDETIPTILGYAKDGILDGVLPENATTLFGHEALTHRRHLDLTCPTLDSAASADFARHLRSRLQITPATQVRAVIAVPATFDGVLRDNLRHTLARHFQSMILLPQPYLAALGYRDESRVIDPDYVDPARCSIFIDLGASAINLCLVQGYYPTAEEQLTVDFGGNHFDQLFREALLRNHSNAELSPITVRLLKEKHACAGDHEKPIYADVILAGQRTTLDITQEVATVCDQLLTRLAGAIKTLLMHAAADDVPELLQNIILTGGGSRIRLIDNELARVLANEFDGQTLVTLAGESYKHAVAIGALKAARQAREHHWQQVTR